MIKFSQSFIEEIKSRIRTSNIVGRVVDLKKNGREFSGLCPFHQEKTPSFTVNDEKGFYHCFGCGAHGNIINFLMKNQGLPFSEAVTQLAKEAGLELPKVSNEDKAQHAQMNNLYEIMQHANDLFIQNLRSPNCQEAQGFIVKRALKKEIEELFCIGYATGNRHGLHQFLKSKNISDKQMLECGLLAKNDKGQLYDKFRNRVIFPIFNISDKIVGFGGRILGDGQPKYLNSPDTKLFKKGDLLYNENLARKVSFKTGRLIVTEGFMDVISLYQAGIKEVVAPLGTAITVNQLMRMWNLSKEPIICLDGDAAGQRAMVRLANLATPLLKPGYTLKFAIMPDSMDPDDVIKTHGVQKFSQILQDSQNLSEILWEHYYKKIGADTPEIIALLEKTLYELAQTIKDKGVSSHYRNFFRQKLNEIIYGYKKKYFAKQNNSRKNLQESVGNLGQVSDVTAKSRVGAESLLILIIIRHPHIMQNDDILEEFVNIEFTGIKLDNIRQSILQIDSILLSGDSKKLYQHLEKCGYAPDISYLEGLNLYQESFIRQNNTGVDLSFDDTRIIDYWKYAVIIYRVALMRQEYQVLANMMNEESEKKAFEIMKQVNKLENELMQIEQEFAEAV